MGDDDRPTGLLTKKDRDWLKVGAEMYTSRQARSRRRQELAKRVRNGLLDFSILWEQTTTEQGRELFDRLGFDGLDHESDPELDAGLIHMLAWVFEGLRYTNIDREDLVREAVQRQENLHTGRTADGRLRHVGDVEVEIDPIITAVPDVDTIETKFVQGEDLSNEELGVLIRTRLGADWVREYLTES